MLNQNPDDVVQLANPDVDVLVTGFPPFPPENYPYITWDEWNEWAHKYIQWRCKAVVTKNEEIYACNRWLPELNHLKIGVDEFGNLLE